tara:strand:- start:184 stop:525 length:342 start_codon:yes stop_codon:yes gene_type:complete
MAHLSLFVTIVMAGPAFYVWVMPTLVELAIILLFGISMSAIEWLRIEGMREAEAAVVAPFEYTRLLFATIIGVLVFSEIPTIWTLVGSTIIIGSTLYTIRRNTLQAMSQDSRP